VPGKSSSTRAPATPRAKTVENRLLDEWSGVDARPDLSAFFKIRRAAFAAGDAHGGILTTKYTNHTENKF